MNRLIFCLFFCEFATVSAQSICFDDRVGLNQAAKAAFSAELRILIANRDTELQTNDCKGSAIALALHMYPPERYSGALGLAYREGNRVLPVLRLYLNPVLKILGNERSSVVVGRALARVAAHEIGHYVHQQLEHDCQGLMRQAFNGAQIAARDPEPFRDLR